MMVYEVPGALVTCHCCTDRVRGEIVGSENSNRVYRFVVATATSGRVSIVRKGAFVVKLHNAVHSSPLLEEHAVTDPLCYPKGGQLLRIQRNTHVVGRGTESRRDQGQSTVRLA